MAGNMDGKIVATGITFDDVLLVPRHSAVVPSEVDVATHLTRGIRLNIPIIGPHEGDQFWIDGLPQQSQMFGFPPAERFTPTRWLHDGDTVAVGRCTLHVRHCPGHTPGHVVFHSAEIDRAFVGDVLFAGSIGRTDFPQGDHPTLIHSITTRLWPMGDQTVFIPGHGPESSFGRERQSNPHVRGT